MTDTPLNPATPPARGEVLYLRLAQTLAQGIRTGALRRGERLSSVRDLARQHGVSLATVTQALRTLEDARLVQARPRSGYFVLARPKPLPEPQAATTLAPPVLVARAARSDLVLRLAEDPAYRSFGAACPSPALFDMQRVRRALARAVQQHADSLVHYRLGGGAVELRRAVARHALRLGSAVDWQQLVITNSCLEALVLALRAVTQPGDTVAIESPTYFGFLEILEHLHLKALEVPSHPRTGISIDALQLALERGQVRAVLAVPTLSNPLGSTMPAPERKRLAQLLATHQVPMIEDVLCNDLAEQEDRRRSVHSFDPSGHVMMCGSFTKTIAPGIRLGWLDAGRWAEPVARMKAATSGGQATVLELALAELLQQPGLESHYRRLRATIAARIDEAHRIIRTSFPAGTRVTDPPGGYILWLELPLPVDTTVLFEQALAERICFAPGAMFSPNERYAHCLRLGVGGRWDDEQRRALRRLGELAGALCSSAPAAAGGG